MCMSDTCSCNMDNSGTDEGLWAKMSATSCLIIKQLAQRQQLHVYTTIVGIDLSKQNKTLYTLFVKEFFHLG